MYINTQKDNYVHKHSKRSLCTYSQTERTIIPVVLGTFCSLHAYQYIHMFLKVNIPINACSSAQDSKTHAHKQGAERERERERESRYISSESVVDSKDVHPNPKGRK